MKTAVSLPNDLFHDIDGAARTLKLTRSALLARAAREFLDKHGAPQRDATRAWNAALKRAGKAADDPAARAFRGRSKAVIRRTRGRSW